MLNIRKQIVTDESNRPVAVQIGYEDWCRIEELLDSGESCQAEGGDDSRLIGSVQGGEDAVHYQRRVRDVLRGTPPSPGTQRGQNDSPPRGALLQFG
ncbi:MAG: hypothetical protein IT449_03630 [Phycisphaerales bacterium]|nr:hypothetical protein [Phycisphaerales bacterium]